MAIVKLHKIEQGVCPYCGSTDIDYDPSSHEDDMETYPATCNTCGKQFEEWYELHFVGHNVGDGCGICTFAGDEDVEVEMDEEVE